MGMDRYKPKIIELPVVFLFNTGMLLQFLNYMVMILSAMDLLENASTGLYWISASLMLSRQARMLRGVFSANT
jgi:hypothetical protein